MPNQSNPLRPLRPNAGGAAPRRKGVRAEQEIVRLLRDAGIPAERVPLSGAAGGRFGGDVILPDGRRAEVKVRRALCGLATLYRLVGETPDPEPVTVDPTARGAALVTRWLNSYDLLFVRANWRPWLVVERRGNMLALWRLEGWLARTTATLGSAAEEREAA